MKLNVQGFAHKAQVPLLLASGILPVVILMLSCFAYEFTLFAWIFAAAYLLLALVGFLIPGKWRLVWGILSASILLGIGALLLERTGEICVLICALPFAVLSFWSVQVGRWSWYEDVPVGVVILCLLVHIAGQFILNSLKNSGSGSYGYGEYSLLAAFWIFMFTAILRMNRDSLYFASHGSRRASKSMRIQNTFLCVSVALLAAVCSAAAPIHSAVRGFFRLLMKLLYGDGTGEEYVDSGYSAATDAAVPTETVEEITEAGGADSALDRILLILTYALVIIAAVLALYFLIRLLVFLFAKLIKWLTRFSVTVSQDYVDEISDISDDSAEKRSVIARIRNLIRDTGPQPDSAREQIRHRYRILARKHRGWADSSTARENIPEEMAALYEKARYSVHEIEDSEAALFKNGTRKI